MPDNVYHRRKVGDRDSKACFICYKPTSTVLITRDGKSDFFYVCDSHLNDSGFATVEPVEQARIDSEKEHERLVLAEMETLKKKWTDKKGKKNDKKKDGDETEQEGGKKEKEKDSTKSEHDQPGGPKEPDSGSEQKFDPQRLIPRVFILDKSIFALRLKRKSDAAIAQKQKESTTKLLSQANAFPKAPRGFGGASNS